MTNNGIKTLEVLLVMFAICLSISIFNKRGFVWQHIIIAIAIIPLLIAEKIGWFEKDFRVSAKPTTPEPKDNE